MPGLVAIIEFMTIYTDKATNANLRFDPRQHEIPLPSWLPDLL